METRKIKAVELHDEDLQAFFYQDRGLSKKDLPLLNCIYEKLCNEADEEEIGDFYDGYGLTDGEYYPPLVVEAIAECVFLRNKAVFKEFYKKETDFMDSIYSFFEKINIEFEMPFHYKKENGEEILIAGIGNGCLIVDCDFLEWQTMSIEYIFRLIEHIKNELNNTNFASNNQKL